MYSTVRVLTVGETVEAMLGTVSVPVKVDFYSSIRQSPRHECINE